VYTSQLESEIWLVQTLGGHLSNCWALVSRNSRLFCA